MDVTYGTVEQTEQLSPTMVRVIFGGEGLASFTSTGFTDEYVNALFIPDGAPYSAPFDLDEARQLDPEFRPRGRRYTVRAWDPDARLLTIDFVAHGDVGYAGRWAQRAVPGDTLQMMGPSGGYQPATDADWHLLAGDESAYPAIAASLATLPAGRKATALVVVDDESGRLPIETDADLDLRWLHRAEAADPSQLLVDAIRHLDWTDGKVDVFVHGEAGEVRAVRRHLLADRGIDRDGASISPYWRRGHDDEAWRAVKRQWIAEQNADA